MNLFKKNERGITLIALVVTIIVLLILAGVAISMLAGDNGILKQAARAKEETEEQSTLEQIKLAATAAMTNTEHKIKSTGELKTELNRYFGDGGYTITPDVNDAETADEWTVTAANGVRYIIKNNGTVTQIGGTGDSDETPKTIEELKESEIAVITNTTLTDENGDSITIPKNFKISGDSPTVVTKGMFIEDSEGNQYVWIPVFEKTDSRDWGVDYSSVTSETDYTNIESALKTYTSTYANSACTDVWCGDANYGKYGYYEESDTAQENLIYYTNGNMTEDEYNSLYHNMLKSVYTNGGFYIGRYEMGIEVINSTTEAQNITRTSMSEYTSTSTNANNTAPSIGSITAPISKANAVGYTYITQSQAQMLANKLGEKADYSNVTTSLMFGVQWDTVCVFIEKFDTNNTATTKSEWLTKNDYSKSWGNYYNSSFTMDRGYYTTFDNTGTSQGWNERTSTAKGTSDKWLCTTGASEQNSSLNIYDFAGNLLEWTLERCSNDGAPYTIRGGSFSASSYYASCRSGMYTYSCGYGGSAHSSFFIM